MGWLVELTSPLIFFILIWLCAPGRDYCRRINTTCCSDSQEVVSGGSTGRQAGKAEDDATAIEFSEFFDANASELKPSAKLLSLNGRRARLVGFMAQMEKPPEGAFYLCPRPVYADESGGGTADLPIGSVRVIVSSAKGKKIQFVPRLIEVTGKLEVGNHTEEDGTVSTVRLILDAPQKPASQDSPSSSSTKREMKPKQKQKE